MKQTFILSLLALVFFSACKKDSDKASGPISVNIDGANSVFGYGAQAVRVNASGLQTIQVIGLVGASGDQIAITIQKENGVTTGTYNENDENTLASVMLTKGGVAYLSDYSETNPATITISSISETSIKGSFKGEVFKFNDGSEDGPEKKVLAEGKFDVQFKEYE
jgi:hypothetical protein